MYVYFDRPYNEEIAISVLIVLIVQMVIHCVLKGAKRCGKN